MTKGTRVASRLAAAAVLALLAACGGDGITDQPPPTPPPPTPPPPRVVAERSGVSIAVGFGYGTYFDTSATGTIDATVDYTHADSSVLVWIAKGQCTGEQWVANQCTYVATSFSGGKPRKVTATGQTAGTYTLIVGNLGPKDEAVSMQVVFTQASAGGSVGASTRRFEGRGFLVPLPSHAGERDQ
jgi:hypothetical protein